jgi:hypothetical protein
MKKMLDSSAQATDIHPAALRRFALGSKDMNGLSLKKLNGMEVWRR